MTLIKYRNERYAASIIGEMTRHGETYVEVAIVGFVTTKWLHHTCIQSKAA